jgi:hypothetical protein
MSLYSIIPATLLLGLSYLIVPPAVLGQSSTSDTTPADNQRTQADSAWVTGVYHPADTTAQRDTISGRDTTRAASDTIPGGAVDTMTTSLDTSRTAGPDTVPSATDTVGSDTSTIGSSGTAPARRTDTASAAAAPADSILSDACDGSGEGSTIAPDLLVVVFAPQVSPGERAAVAEAVDGKLLGPVIGQPGAYYIRLPPGSEEPGLRAAADELIRLTQVRQVGSRSCPSAAGT